MFHFTAIEFKRKQFCEIISTAFFKSKIKLNGKIDLNA